MHAKKADRNQPEIVKALREEGCQVQHLHAVGAGCPDLLCSVNGWNFLVEVKDGEKAASAQRLTEDQVVWHRGWKAEVHIVRNVEEARAVAAIYKRREAA